MRPIFKLTQKIPAPASAVLQGYTMSTVVRTSVLSQLSAKVLAKVLYDVAPFGIDVFEGVLEGTRPG